MKSVCQVCGQTYRGIPLTTVKDAKKVDVCPSCYKILDAEYKKNSCLACTFFHIGSCELFGTDLDEPYLQNQTCEFFTTSTDSSKVGMVKIKKLESTGHFKEAAEECEKLGLHEKADEIRGKIKEAPLTMLNTDELIERLEQRGQTLTYFCCHCGTPLKVGAQHELKKTCPNCKYDLSAIDMAKLLNQHL